MKTSLSCIEVLEQRIAPAGILSLTFGKAGVVLAEEKGAPGASSIAISLDANGSLHVDPLDATQIRFNGALLAAGDEAVVPGFVGSLTATLGAGTDQLTISGSLPAAVTVDLGADPNNLTLNAATIGGKLTVKAGPGADTVTFSGATTRIYGGVNLTLGDGVNALNNTTTSLLHVGGDFVATSGKGNDDLLMGGADVQILGKLSLTTGAGADQAGFSVTGRLDIARDATLASGGLAGSRTDQKLNGGNVFIGGSVSQDVKAGQADQEMVAGSSIFVGGAAKFTSGGTDALADVLLGASAGTLQSMTVGGLITATTKSPDSDFEIRAVTFGSLAGGLNVSGFTEVVAQLSGSIGGTVKAALGGTQQSGYFYLGTILNATEPLYVGAVTMTTKNTDSTLSLGKVVAQGAVKITGTKGGDFFGADDTLFLAAATIDLGAGADTFGIENGNSPTGVTQVNAPLTLLGGAGVDTFNLSGGNANTTLNAVASIIVDGGADADVVNRGANGNYQAKIVEKNIP